MPERSQFQRQVDELLYYIGSINWESDGFDGRLAATDPLNPLRPIYDAIALIKMDLDHLYRERRQAEEEKQHLALKLQNAQKMEAIGTLAGGVAHDLNNILSGLVSYPELLLMDLAEDSPLRAPLKTIQKSGEKAATIVQDLLTLARRGVAVKEVMNLNQILQEYLQTPEYEKLMGYHPGVVLSTDLASDLLNISGSPVHISKTLMNLISNAAEAMPQGGTIHLATSNAYIDRPISGYDDVKEGEYVILKIADTGIGITAEDGYSSRSIPKKSWVEAEPAWAWPWCGERSRITWDTSTLAAHLIRAPCLPSIFPPCAPLSIPKRSPFGWMS